jgi:hypothetical protein
MKSKLRFELSKNFILCSLFLFVFNQLKSQNLVPNSSFEEFINFDTTTNEGWHKAQNTDTPV